MSARKDLDVEPAAPRAQDARDWKLDFLPLGAALVASCVVALDRLGAITAPGCGPGSTCAAIMRGDASLLPGLGVPTALVGVVWFAGWIAFVAARRGLWTRGSRALAVLGVLASLALLMFMLAQETLCPWYAAVHLANLGWWWLARRRAIV